MTQVLFYEKPGCAGNLRQKRLLARSGHTIEARDLLAEGWTPARLLPFLADRPVAEWFNPASPRVRSGEIQPARLDAEQALAALCADPLLIRRPLMAAEGTCVAGFDEAFLARWIGLAADAPPVGEHCPRPDGPPCDPG